MREQVGRSIARVGESEFRAENGRISCTNSMTGEFSTRSIKESIAHMEDMYAQMKPKIKARPRHYSPIVKFLEEIAAVIREAQEQGCPDDRSMMDDRVRRRRLQLFIP